MMTMNTTIEIPAKLFDDEVVRYFAQRYHATAEDVVRCFFAQSGEIAATMLLGGQMAATAAEPPSFRLEDNEMEIMRGLVYDKK